MIAHQFVEVGQPTPKPTIRRPVTESLSSQIQRVEPDAVKQVKQVETLNSLPAVKQAVFDSPPVVKQAVFDSPPVVKQAVFDSPPVVKQAESATPTRKPGSVRSSPESLRAYHREYQRRRRAAAKADKLALADADA